MKSLGHRTHLLGALTVSAALALQASADTDSDHLPSRVQAKAGKSAILADLSLLQAANIEVLEIEPLTQVAYAQVSPQQQAQLSALAHERGSCGGFEALPTAELVPAGWVVSEHFGQLAKQELKSHAYAQSFQSTQVTEKPEITAALEKVSAERLRSSVEFLSSYHTRYHRHDQANEPIEAFRSRIEETLRESSLPYEIHLIEHSSTRQKSIKVRITGRERPQEIIILGAHIDSVNNSWFGRKSAPGADDNASGSANLLESLRVLAQQKPLARSIEFIWYAGEEGGLLGSGEIAQSYRSQSQDVIAVLQLDMTLFAGDGSGVIGTMTDYTSPWLRAYFSQLNRIYLGLEILESRCGYGCSDHASWHRQGYPTLMTSEASFRRTNRNLHSGRDLIDKDSDFEHSAAFSRIALAIAMDLGDSELREPTP